MSATFRKPNREEYLEILEWSDDILRWSIAPELEERWNWERSCHGAEFWLRSDTAMLNMIW